jgi:hypothetical protein
MRAWFLLLFLLVAVLGFGQKQTIRGLVLDAELGLFIHFFEIR